MLLQGSKPLNTAGKEQQQSKIKISIDKDKLEKSLSKASGTSNGSSRASSSSESDAAVKHVEGQGSTAADGTMSCADGNFSGSLEFVFYCLVRSNQNFSCGNVVKGAL